MIYLDIVLVTLGLILIFNCASQQDSYVVPRIGTFSKALTHFLVGFALTLVGVVQLLEKAGVGNP